MCLIQLWSHFRRVLPAYQFSFANQSRRFSLQQTNVLSKHDEGIFFQLGQFFVQLNLWFFGCVQTFPNLFTTGANHWFAVQNIIQAVIFDVIFTDLTIYTALPGLLTRCHGSQWAGRRSRWELVIFRRMKKRHNVRIVRSLACNNVCLVKKSLKYGDQNVKIFEMSAGKKYLRINEEINLRQRQKKKNSLKL